MNRKRFFSLLSGFLATLGMVLGLKLGTPAPASAQSTSLLVAAAASLQNALEEIKPLFEAANSGVTVSYNFAASGPLQQQIEQGAPVDVFLSAAARQMDALQEKNLIVADTRKNLLTNQLVLVVPSNSTLGITSFRQLTGSNVRRISVGEPRSVPVGQYTEEFFKNIGIWDQVQSKLVFGNSVRNVLASVESGNADAGVVYTTDAKISDQVTQVATAPSDQHAPIIYPMAVIAASRNQQAARAYTQFLQTAQAQEVFKKYGFGLAS